jgi:hypothetical protein
MVISRAARFKVGKKFYIVPKMCVSVPCANLSKRKSIIFLCRGEEEE